MNHYLAVDAASGMVVNAILWDGSAPYEEPGVDLVPVPTSPPGVWVGWALLDGEWVPPR